MEISQPHNFKERLSQWIASQGFWFQLRHAMSGGGGWSVAFYHLLRMGLRLLVVAAVVAFAMSYFLKKRVSSPAYVKEVTGKLAEELRADEVEIRGLRRNRGVAQIRRLGARGGEESVFESFEATNLEFRMGYFDGLDGEWDAGVIHGNSLEMELKPGAVSAEAALAAAASVLETREAFTIRGLEFLEVRLTWGYYDRTYGEIIDSRMSAARIEDGWRLTFEGGSFSQNWFRDFPIQRLVVRADADGLEVEEGLLGDDAGGWVRLDGVKVGAGEMPEVSGNLVLEHTLLNKLLPSIVSERVEGKVSGSLAVQGSPNSSQGVGFQGRLTLDGRDSLALRDKFDLLAALEMVDLFNSYRRVEFQEGGFELRSGNGELELTDIDLVAPGLMTLRGELAGRKRSGDEVSAFLGAGDPIDEMAAVTEGMRDKSGEEVSLREAAAAVRESLGEDRMWEGKEVSADEGTADKETPAETEVAKEDDGEFFTAMAERRKLNRLETQLFRREQMERLRRSLVFEGNLVVEIPGDAFNRSALLKETYPPHPETDRIALELSLFGPLETLSETTGERLRRLHREGK